MRGSSASPPLDSRSSASSSSRSAWRSAASRTSRCWAMTSVLRVRQERGRARAGAAATSAAERGRPREARLEQAGAVRRARERVAPLAPDEPVGLGGLVERAVAGHVERRDRRRPASPRRGTRPPARARSRRGRRGRPRRRPPGRSHRATVARSTTAASRASTPTSGIAAPMTGAASSGMNRATVHSTASAIAIAARAIQARRTMRRSHRRRRCGASDGAERRRATGRAARRGAGADPAG